MFLPISLLFQIICLIIILCSVQASSDSKLHVLHEWEEVGETYNNNGLYPAAQSSDVMLQTLGIMRVGGVWRYEGGWGLEI